MADLEQVGVYKFDNKIALGLFRKRSLLLLFAQGFVGVFPWQVITFWFFRYLEVERFYDSEAVLTTMAPAILVLAAGYFVGGALGDILFRRTPRGRLIISMIGVLTGAILFYVTLNVPVENQSLFMILMIITALFIPFASANVISTVYDITLPEVRSTALAIQYFLENGGAALAPLLAGFIARSYSLHVALLTICISAWIVGSILLAFTAYFVPKDIQTLRDQMEERAELERSREAPDIMPETA
jgi:MFS family permease